MVVEILDCLHAATITGTRQKTSATNPFVGGRNMSVCRTLLKKTKNNRMRVILPPKKTKNPNGGCSFSGSSPESRRRRRDDAGRGGFTARPCEGDENPGNIIVQKSREQCGISCLTSWDQTPLSGPQTSAAYLKRGLKDGEAVVWCLGAA